MQGRKVTLFAPFLSCMVLAMTSIASAGAYSNVFVYGDSLSDVGNIYAASGNTYPPSPPYYPGRFSNGKVTVEYLADALHAPLTSFAWGGATTGFGNSGDSGTQTMVGTKRLPGMLPQVAGSLSAITPFAPTSLFVVWGGPDDYITNGTVTQGIKDILDIVGQLQSRGATHILVPGMPDLGLTPFYLAQGTMQAKLATEFSLAFDQALQHSLPKGRDVLRHF